MFYFNLNYDLLFCTFMDENDKLPNVPSTRIQHNKHTY